MNSASCEHAANDAVRECLEQAAPALGCHESSIVDVQRERSAASTSTSYSAEIVTVRLSDGRTLKVFLKNFDSFIRLKNGMRDRREREVRVYRDLLANTQLGTAAYYGTVWDEEPGRHWLLLEFVEGIPVRHCEVETWIGAARCMGRIHGYFSNLTAKLSRCEFLVRHDADFLMEKAAGGMRGVAEMTPDLQSAFQPIVDEYGDLMDAMASPPFTLVHSDFQPFNVMFCSATRPERFCVFDWESAAYGSPYLDLAKLVDGFEPPVLDRFFEQYAEGAADFGMTVPSLSRLRYCVNCFRLHVVVNWMSNGLLKGYSAAVFAKLVATAQTRMEEVRRSADGQG